MVRYARTRGAPRRPKGRHRSPFPTPPPVALVLFAILTVLVVPASLALAACAGDEAPSGSPSPTAGAATAREALVAYLDMLERGQFGDLDRVATPRYLSNHAGGADAPLAEVRLLDLTLQPEADGEHTLAQMTVYIDPGTGRGAWGDEAMERSIFARLVQDDDGDWLIDDFGTGP